MFNRSCKFVAWCIIAKEQTYVKVLMFQPFRNCSGTTRKVGNFRGILQMLICYLNCSRNTSEMVLETPMIMGFLVQFGKLFGRGEWPKLFTCHVDLISRELAES